MEDSKVLTYAKDAGVFTAAEAVRDGISMPLLRYAVKQGYIANVARGVYCLSDAVDDEMFILQHRFARGVYSHNTALYLLGLTDRSPIQYTMTFPYGYNRTNAEKSGVSCYTCIKELYELDVVAVASTTDRSLRCYSAERTLCDILRKRASCDIAEVAGAFRMYAMKPASDPSRLISIARRLGVAEKATSYLEALK